MKVKDQTFKVRANASILKQVEQTANVWSAHFKTVLGAPRQRRVIGTGRGKPPLFSAVRPSPVSDAAAVRTGSLSPPRRKETVRYFYCFALFVAVLMIHRIFARVSAT